MFEQGNCLPEQSLRNQSSATWNDVPAPCSTTNRQSQMHRNQKEIGSIQNYKQEIVKKPSYMVTVSPDLIITDWRMTFTYMTQLHLLMLYLFQLHSKHQEQIQNNSIFILTRNIQETCQCTFCKNVLKTWKRVICK